jgi:hypothetical protein
MRADAATLVLVHSPLVGPLTWRPVASALAARGWHCVVPSLLDAFADGPPYYARLAERVASSVPTDGPLALIGHSFAGALLPCLAAACRPVVFAELFVDALLPRAGQSWFETVPAEFAAHVRSLASDGVLKPWHQWFPSDAVAAVLPDAALRATFESEVPRLPLALFEEPLPDISDVAPGHAYLQLSAPYAPLADEAERNGWPTIREPADHLAPLTRPGVVAGHLQTLLEALP